MGTTKCEAKKKRLVSSDTMKWNGRNWKLIEATVKTKQQDLVRARKKNDMELLIKKSSLLN